ncbi:DNA-binding transcriptional regulator, LysR family [Paenibacillus sp. UNCCL117]|uniref:LysR family transcriptional regulator n=1 Tax=unclassified Paenibacillus TaxID=185978 RepID=UPI000884F0BF|nr:MULTISPECIES: LysR family transcriptional regulator [unclassified Paenibacillus]SDE37619.1 DNA-binding transcriptional regulator, LysR family [Paenibacillus sp. cl123]SFW64973.1 DNA-binding transcriptional regulator, LysR family [Paenibacillus sp. UNCCL117]
MLDRLEGRFFRTFIAVLEEGGIGRAAEKLGYVQSTVTTQIRLLEESVGQRLFDRLPRGVEPTEAGRRLASYAYRFLELGTELEAGMTDEREPRGTVRLRALESFAAAFLWEPLQAFMARYGQVEVQLDCGFQSDTIEALRERRIELGLIPGDPGLADIEFLPIADDELIWVAAPAQAARLAADGSAAVGSLRLIGFGPRCAYTAEAEASLARMGAAVSMRAEFASLEMIVQAVRSGWGLAFIPRSSVRPELAAGELAVCAGLGGKSFSHGLVRLKRKALSLPAELLHAHIAGCGMNRLMIE